jgi:Ni/Fe-hydrogenase subunit HybB-like protein
MQDSIYVPKLRIGSRRFNVFPLWIALLISGLIFGGFGGYEVLRYGLQVTGLNNHVTWGLWIIVDLSSIALGGSAFVFGVMVYLLKLKRFENIGRLAVLLGFLGYSTAGLVLLFDLGQPLRFWHPVVFWQHHSLLWEITMCVVLYLNVLIAELIPIVLEHPVFADHPLMEKYPILRTVSEFLMKFAHWLHKLGPFWAIAGLTLSILHQASLGATYGMLVGRGIPFDPTTPVLFILSAMAGGTALLFGLGILVFRVMRPGLVEDDVLYAVAKLAGSLLLLWVYIRMWDWAVVNYYSFNYTVAEQTSLLDKIAPFSASFWYGQILLGVVVGFILLYANKIKSWKFLAVVGLLPAILIVILRWDYNFSGLVASVSYDPFTPIIWLNSYTPTWQEWAVATGVISYWLMGFSLAARYLPFHATAEHEH